MQNYDLGISVYIHYDMYKIYYNINYMQTYDLCISAYIHVTIYIIL